MQNLLNSMDPGDISPELFLVSYVTMILILIGLALNIVFLMRVRRKPPHSPQLVIRLLTQPWDWRHATAMLGVIIASIHLGIIEIQFIGLILAAIYIHQKGFHIEKAFGLKRPDPAGALGKAGIFMLITLPPLIFYSLIYRIILYSTGIDTGYQEAIKLVINPDTELGIRIYIITMAIAAAPFAEEFFFRGIMLPATMKLMSPIRAVIVISMLFALLHFHVASIVPLFILSVSFCLAYIYTGNMLVPIFMHMIFNAVNIGLLFFLKDSITIGG